MGVDVHVYLDFDHRLDVPGVGSDGEALDHALVEHTLDAVADGALRGVHLVGDLRVGCAGVPAEDREDLAVEVVHRDWTIASGGTW